MKTITGKDVKLLPELIYDEILKIDEESGFLKDHISFSKDDILEDAKKLHIYQDMSISLFMTQCPNILHLTAKGVREKLYEDMRYIDYKDKHEDGRPTIKYHDWQYTFYDNTDMKVEYHREKSKINGEDIDYIRIIVSLTAEVNKNI